MKTLILYRSKSGATKQYAEWLSEELADSTLENMDEFNTSDFDEYNSIVIGSPTYGGIIIGKDFLEENWDKIKDKKVYLMAVGAVPQEENWSKQAFNQIKKEVREGLSGYVKLPGVSLSKKKPNFFERFAMKLFLKSDPNNIKIQQQVKREDLKPALQIVLK